MSNMKISEAQFIKAPDLLVQPIKPNTNSKLPAVYSAEIWLPALA